MKVSVDAKELDKAFNAVANARNHFTEQNYAMQQLQTACNILGPMWVHGVNEIESKENLEDSINQQVSDSAYDFMNEPSCLVTKDAYSRVTVTGRDVDIKASWKVVGDTPGENADEITDDDRRWADEAIEKHLEKHDDSQIPVRSKEKNIQAIKESLAKNPGKIFPSYIPAVEEVDHNRRPVEFNPPCAEYCIPEMEKIMQREVNNHRAVLEILDIMMDSNCNRGWNRSTVIGTRLRALQNKLEKNK